MKILKKIAIVAVIIAVGLVIFKNPLIKTVVSAAASQVTGAPVEIGSFAVGIFKPAIRIKNFKLYNPKGFPNVAMVDIPQISVDYNLTALVKGKLHLPLVVVNLKEMVVIKNKEGKLNVDALKVTQKQPEQPKKEQKQEVKKASKPLPMQIDVLTLTVGKVVLKDYSQGEQPVVSAYDVGIKDKTYKNINSAEKLVTIILVEAMGPTAIKGAGIYAAATVLGIGFLPAGVAGVLIGKDSGEADFNVSYERAYKAALETLTAMGQGIKENSAKGLIQANVSGAGVTVQVIKQTDSKVKVQVSARKYMMPKPEIAEGVLYQISQKLE